MNLARDSTASTLFINGYGRFSQKARQFAVKAAISSRVAEGLQAELLEDSRVALKYNDLYASLADEMRWVIDIDGGIWRELGKVCGCDDYVLRDDTIAAAHTCFHFVWRRVMTRATSLPWRLCRGDIKANLQALAAQEVPPTEPTTWQIWELMNEHDYSEEVLVRLVECLSQCPWTSLPAEQQHGSLAMLKKWHPDYSTEVLVGRALMHQGVRILPSLRGDHLKLAQVQKQLRSAMRKDPTKVGPKHMLVQALFRVIKQKKDVEGVKSGRCSADKE